MKQYKGEMMTILFKNALVLLLISLGMNSYAFPDKKEETADAEKPNIIFILTDDQRWDALGAMGNPLIKTPNLDDIAANGILFTNAYVTTSVCCVSRASILTGQYQSRHQINDFVTSLTPVQTRQTYPLLLKQAGYKIGFVGKYGVGNPKDQPIKEFDFWASTNQHQPDYETIDAKGDTLHNTDLIAGDVRKFISEYGGKEPFCLSVSFKAPHVQDNDPRQFIPAKAYASYYYNDVIPVPPTANDEAFLKLPSFLQGDTTIARQRWKQRFASAERYQKSVKDYYRLITHVDDVVGNMRKQLETQGIADNTIIVFMGDNGFFLGEHGLAGKWYGYQESVRVPLIIYDPRRKEKQRLVSAKIALNIDIAPTILARAEVPVPPDMQGVDLYGLLEGKIPERQFFFYEHRFLGSPQIPITTGLIGKSFKYLVYPENNYEEFFDLDQDPHETKNLMNQKAYQHIISRYKNDYAQWHEKVK